MNFQALKQESTSIEQPLQLLKLNLTTFLVPKHACTTSTGLPWEWKLLYLVFPAQITQDHHDSENDFYLMFLALKQKFKSIAQPLQLFWNTPAQLTQDNHNSENEFIWLPTTETRVRKHGTETSLYKPPQDFNHSENDFVWSSQHWNRSQQAPRSLYGCQNWILSRSWFKNTPAQPAQDHHRSENDFTWSSQHWNSSPPA